MITVLLSAGDASGDLHAADLVRALRLRCPDARFVGLGGDEMQKAGVELFVHQRALAVGGLVELLAAARRIVSAWRGMVRLLDQLRPDLVVLVDSGGFNLPFARRVRRRCNAPILYFVAPQVWAWRRRRIAKIAERVDRLAVIFPFEPEVYAQTSLRVDYVGHPLVEKLDEFDRRLERGGARSELGLEADGPVLAIFPGSRRNEIRRQLPVQLKVIEILQRRRPETRFLLVIAPTVSREQVDEVVRAASLPASVELRIIEGRSRVAILASDLALAKPGTITVELALLARPMVVVGITSAFTAAVIRRAVKLSSLTMPNLIAGARIVPEFLQEEARPERIADALSELYAGPEREHQLKALADVKQRLGTGGAAGRAAAIAEEMIGPPQP